MPFMPAIRDPRNDNDFTEYLGPSFHFSLNVDEQVTALT